MSQCYSLNVNFFNLKISKLKYGVKTGTEVTLVNFLSYF